jgi:hypothetical protein
VRSVVRISVDTEAISRRFGRMASEIIEAVDAGLGEAAEDTASHIARTRLSGSDLKARTGMLRREIAGWMLGSGAAVVGVPDSSPARDYAWLLGSQTKTITPKNAKRLAIPLAAALTASGVPRYPEGPRSVKGLFYMRTAGGTELLVRSKGKRGRIEALFVLKKSVTIEASGALPEGVKERRPQIKESIQRKLDGLIRL